MDHLDVIQEILAKTLSSAITTAFSINYNFIRDSDSHDFITSIATLLWALNLLYKKTSDLNMNCKSVYRLKN